MTRLTVRARTISLLVLATAALFTVPALADDQYPDYPMNSARIGLYSIFYHVHSDGLTGPYVPAGSNIDAKDVETLYLAYVRSLTTHFDLELAGGWPPLQKTVGKGPATLGSVPYNPDANFRPYIGGGVNYTVFYDRDTTAAGDAVSGGPTKLSLTSSVGVAGTVGLSYRITGNFKAYLSYSASQVKTRLEADTAGVERTAHINFGPQALVAAVGYSF